MAASRSAIARVLSGFPITGVLRVGFLMAALAAAGCGEDTDEAADASASGEAVAAAESAGEAPRNRSQALAALEELRAGIARQTSAVDAAQADVDAARAELEAAESRLEVARGSLGASGRQLQAAQDRLREYAVADPLLFRSVQKALLDAPALQAVAIAAEVKDGAVTLRGSVPDPATRDSAEVVAREVVGVISIENQIVVVD